MPTTVKKVTLWRREIPNRKGALAESLEPLATGGVNLRCVMAYAFPGSHSGAVEVFPVDAKDEAVAKAAGLTPAKIPCLLVEGDDAPGLGAKFARAVADTGVNMDFLMGTSIGGKYAVVIGFASEADLGKAQAAVEKA